MRCPVCHAKDTRVADSRLSGDEGSIRRRRVCAKCTFRFSTVEDVQILDLTVCKSNGRREPYSREKLVGGVLKALEKRSVTQEQQRQLVRSMEMAIQRLRSQEVTSKQIGEIVMHALEKFDHVAYIRFASVYRRFEDVGRFQAELARLVPKKGNSSKKQLKKRK